MPRDGGRVSGAELVARWQRRTAALFRAPAIEREMDEEMRLHVELEAADYPRGEPGAWTRRRRSVRSSVAHCRAMRSRCFRAAIACARELEAEISARLESRPR